MDIIIHKDILAMRTSVCAKIRPAEHRGPIRALMISLCHLMSPRPETEMILERELLRLLETSPHLLADIGFTKDLQRSTADQTVWISERAEVVQQHPQT